MADLNQAITGNVNGAYQTMLLLSDGTIESVSKYWANVNGRTVVSKLAGAYNAQSAKTTDGIVDLAADLKATGGKTILSELHGAYNARVQVDGELVSLATKIANDAN